MYRPKNPFNVPMFLLIPTVKTARGMTQKTYPKGEAGEPFNGSFRTFGGTENNVNGIYALIDTATVETWYRPDIKAECRVFIPATGKTYEIIGEPENIDLRNQFLQFKVRGVGVGNG